MTKRRAAKATPGCGRCGQTHDPRKCTGHVDEEDGSLRPCLAFPVRGATVCVKHGGGAPQVKAAAARREQATKAEAAARRAFDDPDAAPVTDWVGELQSLTGRVKHAVDAVGRRVNELEGLVDDGSESGRLRAEVDVWVRLLAQFRGLLVDMGRLDLDERAQRLAEDQTSLMVAEVLLLLAALGRDDDEGRRVLGWWLMRLDALSQGLPVPELEAATA